MKKNDVIEVRCSGLGSNGEGIAAIDGFTLFVPYLLPGERASVRVLKVKGNIAYGKAEEIHVPAEDRVRPKCPVFYRCGGCLLQHMRYRSQLLFKADLVKNAFRKIAGIDADVQPCERSEREYGYRNKLQLPVGAVRGENAIGFYAERTHRIVKTDECPIHPAWSKPLIAALYNFMEKCGLDGYDEETGKGQIRHIIVREVKNKFLVTLVTTEEIAGIDYFCYLLDAIFPVYSLFLSIDTSKDNVVLKEPPRLLKGKPFYEGMENGILFEAGASTFLQVNEGVREKLYERVVSLFSEEETVIDCYAGGGLLTAMLAKKCKRAYGIEIVPEASACAESLKQKNGLETMVNLCGRVEEELPALLQKDPDAALIFDPPRAGLGREIVRGVLRHAPRKIVYISCNPATLARDVGILTGKLIENEGGELIKTENGPTMYEITLVQPFDMFPQTKHVETLVVLSHKKPDGHIGVKVEFGEEEGQISLKEVEKRAEERKPKEKVTYKMIQEYIEKTYGFKVHTAYIAEVKRSLGLPMYDAPNAVEELKRPRSHPSPQMVGAIKETLKHFEII